MRDPNDGSSAYAAFCRSPVVKQLAMKGYTSGTLLPRETKELCDMVLELVRGFGEEPPAGTTVVAPPPQPPAPAPQPGTPPGEERMPELFVCRDDGGLDPYRF